MAAPSYTINFEGLAEYAGVFTHGVLLTAGVAAVVTVLGIMLGIAGAVVRHSGRRNPLYYPWTAYVEIVRNTPFIVQLFFIFFGLPSLGFQFTNEVSAAILALVLNLGAYATEIVRAGIAVTPKGQWEAARVLGLSRLHTYLRVVLPPALKRVWPALVGQCVLVMLGSAVISQISVQDLTYAANWAQSLTFLSFECYLIATLLYLALAVLMRRGMLALGRRIFKGGC
ncbi:amino acid ABC transporter permease [Sutterella sp.]|uniref:amino acid ABC transporter permease n=1 Tax=Sutterella sp. TaxID=1981025 RepID=UPI0026E085CD|nr:amino acid ABC transporter permease [Sutterella sp.]MDO5531966.1 amino acid ABC transporter permease [Sutterella sp.]